MDAIFAIVLQKLVHWTLDNVHWKTFNRPIWFSGRWFLSSWYFQFTLRYSPLSLWYFQYWKSIWKQHDNDCLPLLKWDVKPLSHCCLRGALKLNLSKNLVFCPNWGGWGSADPKFWFNFSKGVFVAIWQGFPSPNQQNHQKCDFSMKK